MLNMLICMFRLLHNSKEVTVSNLAFLIEANRIGLNCLVVLLSLICSILTRKECLHCDPKLTVRSVCVSVLMHFNVLCISHITSLAVRYINRVRKT